MSRQSNKTRGIVLTSFVGASALALAACTPPMPPDVLAALAESQIVCQPGEVQVAVPEGFTGSMDAIGLGLGGVCPETTVLEVPEGEAAPVALVDRTPSQEVIDAFTATSCPTGSTIVVPAFAYPVSMAYNVIGLEGVVMTPEIVAGILNGTITSWEDPLILAANEGFDFSGLPELSLMDLEAPSGAVQAMTAWLAQQAPESWTAGTVEVLDGGQKFPTSMDLIAELTLAESAITVMPVFQSFTNVIPTANLPVTQEDGSELVITADDVQLYKVGSGAMEITTDPETGSMFASPAVGGVPVEGNFDLAASKIVLGEGQPLLGWPVNGVAHLLTCDSPGDPGALAFTQYALRLAGQGALETFGVTPLPEPIRVQTFGPLKVTVPGADGEAVPADQVPAGESPEDPAMDEQIVDTEIDEGLTPEEAERGGGRGG
jgi:ABC-type phosphate transport system substrate-binding protein